MLPLLPLLMLPLPLLLLEHDKRRRRLHHKGRKLHHRLRHSLRHNRVVSRRQSSDPRLRPQRRARLR
jgi:hypothetical protein